MHLDIRNRSSSLRVGIETHPHKAQRISGNRRAIRECDPPLDGFLDRWEGRHASKKIRKQDT